MNAELKQLILNGASPKDLCDEGICVSQAEGRRLAAHVRASLLRWLETAGDLNPDKGMIAAAREWCEDNDVTLTVEAERVVFDLLHPEA